MRPRPACPDGRAHASDVDSKPPQSIEPEGIFTGLSVRAIVLGVVVDSLASFAAGLVLATLFLVPHTGEDGSVDQEALEALATSSEFLLLHLVIGLACTAFGAYVGARRAGDAFVRHGAWIALGSASLALMLYAAQPPGAERVPLWLDISRFALLLPAGVLGGALAGFVQRRSV